MKSFLLFIILSLGATSFSCDPSTSKSSTGFAVVELFTSEGCSSCPPADKVVAKLLKEHKSNVYVLGYHVDYWDDLGWKDIFSNNIFTQRQKAYAKAFKLSSVYTPQIVVNGTEQFVGSDEGKLNNAVAKNLQQPSNIKLNIDAKAGDGNNITVQYSTDAAAAIIHIALIQLEAENKIQRGENSGATLHHVNIVRDIKTFPPPLKGTAVLKLPVNLKADECSVIDYTQNINDNKITAAIETGIK